MMQLKPESGEGASQYANKLRKAGDKCDFSNWSVENMIKCLIIANMHDEEILHLMKSLTFARRK